MTVGGDGLQVVYAIHDPNGALRKRNGVPMATAEDRLRFRLTEHDAPNRWVAITVNGNGKCVVHGYALTEDQSASCKVAAIPSPSPTPTPNPSHPAAPAPPPTPKPDFPCPDSTAPAPAKPDKDALCASVTIALEVLQTILTPVPSIPNASDTDHHPDKLDVCVQVVQQGVAEASIDAQCQDPPPTGTPKPAAAPTPAPAARFPTAVSYYDDAPHRWRLSGQVANTNNTSSAGGGSSASSSGFRRTAATSAGGVDQKTKSTALGGLVTLVHPFSYDVRSSIEYQNNNLVSSTDKQTQLALSKVSAARVTANQSTTKLDSTTDDNDTFQNFDSTRLFGIVQPPVVRGRVKPDSATKAAGAAAFDYTDLIELAPFDTSTLKAVTYGGKLVWSPTSSVFATGYYRDYKQGATGTLLHGEGTFGAVTAGVSEVVANANTSSSNKYVTTGPDGTGSPRKHSTNTVIGVLTPFGQGSSYQAFTRLGITNSGNDYLGLLSWSSAGGGTVVNDAGDVRSYNALAGDRAIDPAYNPLATRYDAFTGSQATFGRLGGRYTQAGNKSDQEYALNVSFTRAKDGFRAVYSSVGIDASFPMGRGPFSLSLTASRSTIAGSVVARQDGAIVATGSNATTLLDNSFMMARLIYTPSDLISLSVGNTSTHAASCDPTTGVCSSKLTNGRNGITASALVAINSTSGGMIFDGSLQPGSVDPAIAGGTTIATNGLKGTLLAAYHYCTPRWNGIEPTLTVKNSVNEDESRFAPGLQIEEAIDIGLGKKGFLGGVALRLTEKRSYPAPGVPFTDPPRAFSYEFVSRPRWQQYKKIDPCVSKDNG
ncbi:MAG TPA: hypothetical protein VIW69_06470 [Candidatus Elarobacter sp.]